MNEDSRNRKRWILNTPYDEPVLHWVLDSQGRATEAIKTGRRLSAELIPVPSETHAREANPNIEPYKTINKIRTAVNTWRSNNYPGTTSVSYDLLEYFAGDDLELRPFWCQRECLETLIWLLEAGTNLRDEKGRNHWDSLFKHVRETSREHNEGITRYAFKMATGTGKTKVMAMVLAWLVLVRKIENVLVITPNLAIKHQLFDLKEQTREIVPRKYRDAISRLKFSVMNFQKFAPRDISGFADTPAKIHRQVVGVSDDAWQETTEQMMNRLLKGHDKSKKFVVINDEAHHCRFTPKKEKGEDQRERSHRMMWARALKQIQDSELLDMVLDFSATPMYLQQQKNMDSTLFPWTITDFPLLESIEAGLVKIPRLPSVDQDESGHDVARRIYENTKVKELKCHGLQNPVRALLHALADGHENEAERVWRKTRDVEPVFIVVANTIANAFELYKYIAGYEGENGWNPGQIPHFSNIRTDGSGPVSTPPTVLVASDIDDPKEYSGKRGQSILDEQIKVHAPELQDTRGARTSFRNILRDMYMSVGKTGELGANIKCVVSVSMLTEGWDCRTVSSVFGYRQFGSSLLCEQVVGRSLRRTEHTLQEDGKLTECYADILGVPFEFMKSRDTPPPRDLTHIYSMPERAEHFHLEFPCVDRYEREITQIGEILLDSDKVGPFGLNDLGIKDIEIEGVIGRGRVLTIEDDSENSALMRLAAICTNNFVSKTTYSNKLSSKHENTHKREIFRQFHKVVVEWWNHEHVRVPLQIIAIDTSNSDSITDMIVEEIFRVTITDELDWDTSLHSILDSFQPSNSTTGIDYRTGKSLCPETTRTEVNRAVCDSQPEAELARILDSHQSIIRWMRNERIGLLIPWYDDRNLRWRKYEPDFLAQGRAENGNLVNLVIEYKGNEDFGAIAKRKYA
ncbi:MAG: hypothetical protein F4Z01_09440 [Gammaproteobacteria bacterium]|nr:hypothetical protein [Gammaproteobacteria bacterium]